MEPRLNVAISTWQGWEATGRFCGQ